MARAFESNTTLQYFDFSPNTIRFIDQNAFYGCSALDPNNFSLSNQLWYIGRWAFLQAFKATGSPVPLKIPGSVVPVHEYGFANLNVSEGSTLYVGDAENYSNINLAIPALSDDYISKFIGNDGVITTYIFYSNLYSTAADSINGTVYQVQNAFIRSDVTATLQVFSNKGV